MQISRHWRLNAQRYRLEGIRQENGELSFQRRLNTQPQENETATPHQTNEVKAVVSRVA